jgi:hypothetical protein
MERPEWKPSKRHLEYIRSLPWSHTPNGLDYSIQKTGDSLFIVFSETYGIGVKARADDWAANLDFFPALFDIFPGSKIKAHDGIARQYLDARQTIMDHLYSGTIKRIFVAGYSQGGAVTTAAVQDIGFHIDRDGLDVSVFGISYNGPRFFGTKKSRLIKQAVKNRLLTIKGHWDPVGHVPLKAMPTFFSFRWKPFRIILCLPHLTLWRDYGKVTWIGKLWRIWPLQHLPEQVYANLLEKYGV